MSIYLINFCNFLTASKGILGLKEVYIKFRVKYGHHRSVISEHRNFFFAKFYIIAMNISKSFVIADELSGSLFP